MFRAQLLQQLLFSRSPRRVVDLAFNIYTAEQVMRVELLGEDTYGEFPRTMSQTPAHQDLTSDGFKGFAMATELLFYWQRLSPRGYQWERFRFEPKGGFDP